MIKRLLARPEVGVVVGLAGQAGSAMALAILSARWLGPADRGLVVVSTVLGSLLMLVGSLGTPTGARVLVALDEARHERMSVADVLASTRILLSAHLFTTTAVGALVFWLVSGQLRWGVLLLFVGYAVLMLAAYIRRELLHGLGKHRAAVNGEILTVVVQLGLTTAAHVAEVLTVETALLSLGLGVGAQLLMQRVLLGEHREGASNARLRLLRYSFPALGTTVGQAFALRGDRLVLGVIASSAAAGVYGSAASLSEALTLVAAGVGQVLFRRSSGGTSRARILKPLVAITALTGIGAAALAWLAPWLIEIALGDAYMSAVVPLRVLCVATVPLATYQVAVAALNGSGRLSAAGRVTLTGAVVLTVGCFVLIPAWGMVGAAGASVVAYTFMAAGAFWSLPARDANCSGPQA
ncbi:lipopolysaccharide biosynthesis protein [Dermacoccus nishinomiyaensis]|uniref:lipopolysaccharide biosynthesis protein n=1 Tax=Dermacoccus nishinomiyaensis TaxID=1274 RepID=UPI0021A8463A|nr:polysaccharide biosynthesis C-terminal domain-containing protein [Dermacoccus nishinomiyaensis]MCT1603729.1 polysaccharide biosynthesis C-terminal domain-containing protein [Dermacoccus nishinomiyaensis]